MITVATTYSYYLNFDANGGTSTPSPYVYKDDISYRHRFSIPYKEPIRNGYHCIGWSTNPSTNQVMYTKGSFIDCLPGITTLYAVWEQDDFDWGILKKINGHWEMIDTGMLL